MNGLLMYGVFEPKSDKYVTPWKASAYSFFWSGKLGWFQRVNILNPPVIVPTKGIEYVSEILRTTWNMRRSDSSWILTSGWRTGPGHKLPVAAAEIGRQQRGHSGAGRRFRMF